MCGGGCTYIYSVACTDFCMPVKVCVYWSQCVAMLQHALRQSPAESMARSFDRIQPQWLPLGRRILGCCNSCCAPLPAHCIVELAALQAVVWCARPLRRLFLLKQSTQHSLHEDPDRSTGGSGFGGFTSTICVSYASPLEPARKNDNCQTLWL
jgi:hypothetical protein